MPAKILILENNSGSENKINSVISECTEIYETEYTIYPDDAITRINKHSFDLIILDLDISCKNNISIFEYIYTTADGTPILTIVNIIDKTFISFLLKKGILNFLYKNKLSSEMLTNAIKMNIVNNKTESKLQLNEKILKKISDNFETGVFVADKNGLIKYANEGFAKLYKLSINEITGKSIEFQLENEKKIEIETESADHKLNYFEINIKKTIWQNEKLFLVSIADISSMKQSRALSILEDSIISTIEDSADLEYCCSEIVYLIQKNTDIESIALRLRNRKSFDFSISAGYNANFNKNEKGLCNCFMSGNFIYDSKGNPVPECVSTDFSATYSSHCNFSITSSGSYWSNHLSQRLYIDNPITTKVINTCKYRIAGYNSMALIPIRSGNVVTGLLLLNDKRENILSYELIRNLEHLCSIIGNALNKKFTRDIVNPETKKTEKNKTIKSTFEKVINEKLLQPLTVFMNMIM